MSLFNEYVANNNVILADGGTMFEMEARGYNSAGRWIPECVLEEPEAVEQMHTEFAEFDISRLTIVPEQRLSNVLTSMLTNKRRNK
ncbi:hypothetical protein GEMRC1_010911 [Eukaryota sp. GEM-RC1]